MSDNTSEVTQELPEGSIEELSEQLEALMNKNIEVEQRMANTFGAAMQPADKVNVRLNCLMSKILPPEHRIEVEIMTQTMLSTILEQMYEAVEKQFEDMKREQARQDFLRGVPGIDPSATGSPLIG
jgi:hypothetical protein